MKIMKILNQNVYKYLISIVLVMALLTGMLNGLIINLEKAGAAASLPDDCVPLEISAGYYHSLVLSSDGTIWSWGRNNYGQLGSGDNVNSATPVQINSLADVSAISAGGGHSLVLIDGNVWAWGYNYYGQLGNGTTTNSLTPVQIILPD